VHSAVLVIVDLSVSLSHSCTVPIDVKVNDLEGHLKVISVQVVISTSIISETRLIGLQAFASPGL